jgi:hypothetical protein
MSSVIRFSFARPLVLSALVTGLFGACDGSQVSSGEAPTGALEVHAADVLPSSLKPEDLLNIVASGGFAMEAKNFGTSNGTVLVGRSFGSGSAGMRFSSQWKVRQLANGRYQIFNIIGMRCVSVRDGATWNGASIILDDCRDDLPQTQWQMVEIATNVFQIRAGHSGKCLQAYYRDGDALTQWDCAGATASNQWSFGTAPKTEIKVLTGSSYATKCLTAKGTAEGAELVQESCNGSIDQKFWVSQGPKGDYAFRAQNSQRCIDIAGAGVENGTTAQMWSCSHTWLSSQMFTPRKLPSYTYSDSAYNLIPGHISKCLDREGFPNTADGAKLRLWACSGQNNQAFALPNVIFR